MTIARKLLAAATLALTATAAAADPPSVNQTLDAHLLLGIHRSNGQLVCYDFANACKKTVGTLTASSGSAMTGIDAAAYFPTFTNIYAFWTDPADNRNKLVYVDTATAAAVVAFDDLEGGRFTGAVGLPVSGDPYAVFAVQQAKVKPPSTIGGSANLNPNNSEDNEFSCTRGDGTVFTRDHLHAASNLPSDGTYYQGSATQLHFKPKGNGNQNTLLIDGKAYNLQNSNTYTFNGDMVLRVYNDKPKDGKAMGHWWVQVISGTVTINGEAQILSPHRLVKVDQRTGVVNEVMRLTRAYSGLASADGVVFYTSAGSDLYKLDSAAETETKIGQTPMGKISDLEFVGEYLMGYDTDVPALGALKTSDGSAVQSARNYGLGQLGPFFFTPSALDPTLHVGCYD